MELTAGQIVVHPHHGPTTVEEVLTRSVRGVETRYLKLKVHRTALVLGVPVANAEEIGLRPVIGPDEVSRLLDVLGGPTGVEDKTWSRRFKDHHEKLRLGDLYVTSGVVRDLLRRQRDSGLSLGEKELLKDARRPLVAEVALALDIAEEDAGSVLDAAALRAEAVPA